MVATRRGALGRATLLVAATLLAGCGGANAGANRAERRSAGGRAIDRRGQPGSGPHQRHRVAGGGRAGLRPPGPLRRRPPRAGARSRRRAGRSARTGPSGRSSFAPGVRFQDGTPLDADAVVFSFERQIVPEHPAHEADFVWARAYHNIRRVRAAGTMRVQFEIDRPYAPFLANLAMGPAAIVSPTAVQEVGAGVRPPPGRHRTLPLRRVDPGRPDHAGAQPDLLGPAGAAPATWC